MKHVQKYAYSILLCDYHYNMPYAQKGRIHMFNPASIESWSKVFKYKIEFDLRLKRTVSILAARFEQAAPTLYAGATYGVFQ